MESSSSILAAAPPIGGAEATLFHLVYVSSAVAAFSEAQLLALLERSRANNARVGVTGLLLYNDGNIVQALEGPEEAVRTVHQRIVRDPRHRGCITLIQAPITERTFAGWSMGFRNLDSPEVAATPGFSDFLNQRRQPDRGLRDPNRAWQLLTSFRRTLR